MSFLFDHFFPPLRFNPDNRRAAFAGNSGELLKVGQSEKWSRIWEDFADY
jgi:hypothetical protein